MMFKIILLWVAGLLSLVPYAIYYLLFNAQRDEYALLITFVLFWFFGFWAIVAPLLSAVKIRRLFKMLESAESRNHFIEIIKQQESQDMAIKLIARENHIPQFIARKIYHYINQKIITAQPTGHYYELLLFALRARQSLFKSLHAI